MEPWTDPNSIWTTKAAFFSWLRGQIRRSWMMYPISNNFKNGACRPNLKGGKGKWLADCAVCGGEFLKSHTEVDHIIPAGKINDWDDVGAFVQGLMTTSDNLRLVCKPCHATKSVADKFGLSMGDARARQAAVKFGKLDVKSQVKELEARNIVPASNAKARRDQFEAWTKEEQRQAGLATRHHVPAAKREGLDGF